MKTIRHLIGEFYIMCFCDIKTLSHCGVNRYASDPRIGLMDSTVSVERW